MHVSRRVLVGEGMLTFMGGTSLSEPFWVIADACAAESTPHACYFSRARTD
jgi:hypothetical protein